MSERFTYEADRTHCGMDSPNDLVPQVAGDDTPTSEYTGYPLQCVHAHQRAIANEDEAARVRAEMEAIERRDRLVRAAGESEMHSFIGGACALLMSLKAAAETDIKLALRLAVHDNLIETAEQAQKAIQGGTDFIEAMGIHHLSKRNQLHTISRTAFLPVA